MFIVSSVEADMSMEPCDGCLPLWRVFRKSISDNRAETTLRDDFEMSKEQAMVLARFIQGWQIRQCGCCFREMRIITLFSALVQRAISLCIKLVHKRPLHNWLILSDAAAEASADHHARQRSSSSASSITGKTRPGNGTPSHDKLKGIHMGATKALSKDDSDSAKGIDREMGRPSEKGQQAVTMETMKLSQTSIDRDRRSIERSEEAKAFFAVNSVHPAVNLTVDHSSHLTVTKDEILQIIVKELNELCAEESVGSSGDVPGRPGDAVEDISHRSDSLNQETAKLEELPKDETAGVHPPHPAAQSMVYTQEKDVKSVSVKSEAGATDTPAQQPIRSSDGSDPVVTVPMEIKESDDSVCDESSAECKWSVEEFTSLVQLIVAVFTSGFPLYQALRHMSPPADEHAAGANETLVFKELCNLSVTDQPHLPFMTALFRNVCYILDIGSSAAFTHLIEDATVDRLPLPVFTEILTLVTVLKQWMNPAIACDYVDSLRAPVLRYLSQLNDEHFRVIGNSNAVNIVNAISKVTGPFSPHQISPRTPTSHHQQASPSSTSSRGVYGLMFDKPALDIALKYFTCSTLTVRLAGVSLINSQINLYREHRTSASSVELLRDAVGLPLITWLLNNKVMEHMFGPNIHVEIVKQSHPVLTFLCTDRKLTSQHLELLWQAAQSKYCGRQVLEILMSVVRLLSLELRLELNRHLNLLHPGSHTEQTVHLTSLLIRIAWDAALKKQLLQQGGLQRRPGKGTISSDDDDDEDDIDDDEDDDDEEDSESCSDSMSPMSMAVQHRGQRTAAALVQTSPMTPPEQMVRPSRSSGSRIGQGERATLLYKRAGSPLPASTSHGCERKESIRGDNSNKSNIRRVQSKQDELAPPNVIVLPAQPGRPVMKFSDAAMLSDSSRGIPRGESVVQTSYRLVDDASLTLSDVDEETRMMLKLTGSRGHSPGSEVASDETNDGSVDSDKECHIEMPMEIDNLHGGDSAHDSTPSPFQEWDPLSYKNLETPERELFASAGLRPGVSPSSLTAERSASVDGTPSSSRRLFRSSGAHNSPNKHSESDSPGKRATSVNHHSATVLPPAANPAGAMAAAQAAILAAALEAGQVQGENRSGDGCLGVQTVKRELKRRHDAIMSETEEEAELRLFAIQAARLDNMADQRDARCGSSANSSNKSTKDLGDFDGEDTHCESEGEEEDAFLYDEEVKAINRGTSHEHSPAGVVPTATIGDGLGNRTYARVRVSGREVVCTGEMIGPQYHGPTLPLTRGDKSEEEIHVESEKIILHNLLHMGEPQSLPMNILFWNLLQTGTVHLLSDTLTAEVEHNLCSLLMSTNDHTLRLRFIAACIENIMENRSVNMSLRVLSQLILSHNHWPDRRGVWNVTRWAEDKLRMITHVYRNLVHYVDTLKEREKAQLPVSTVDVREDIGVRFDFLSRIFSVTGSDEEFGMSFEHINGIWDNLGTYELTTDVCMNWFRDQAREVDYHAVDVEGFQYLFVHKFPEISMELMRPVAFDLFEQLHKQAAYGRGLNTTHTEAQEFQFENGVDQLWKIALCARNPDVNKSAIGRLNACYIEEYKMTREEDFVRRCMLAIVAAKDLLSEKPTVLPKLMRAVQLLNTHVVAVRIKYAYYIRTRLLACRANHTATNSSDVPMAAVAVATSSAPSARTEPTGECVLGEEGGKKSGSSEKEDLEMTSSATRKHPSVDVGGCSLGCASGGKVDDLAALLTGHQRALYDKHKEPLPIRVNMIGYTATGKEVKSQTVIEILPNDLVGELRAEVTFWWRNEMAKHAAASHCVRNTAKTASEHAVWASSPTKGSSSSRQSGAARNPRKAASPSTAIMDSLLQGSVSGGDGLRPESLIPLKVHYLGNELVDDSVTLSKLGLRDHREHYAIYVCPALGRRREAAARLALAHPAEVSLDRLPTVILLQKSYFDDLFDLLNRLSNLNVTAHTKATREERWKVKAKAFSHTVWELLLALPTNPALLKRLKDGPGYHKTTNSEGDKKEAEDWGLLLDTSSAAKLEYSLQIVESLSKVPRQRKRPAFYPGAAGDAALSLASESVTPTGFALQAPEEEWTDWFVQSGGLAHLFNILISKKLQAASGSEWDAWSRECLAYLLRLLSHFAMARAGEPLDAPSPSADDDEVGSAFTDDVFSERGEKATLRRHDSGPACRQMYISQLNKITMEMIDDNFDAVLDVLKTIVYDAAVPDYATGTSRAEVLRYAFSFLASWAFTDPAVTQALCTDPSFNHWLRRITLMAEQRSIRLETGRGLCKICIGVPVGHLHLGFPANVWRAGTRESAGLPVFPGSTARVESQDVAQAKGAATESTQAMELTPDSKGSAADEAESKDRKRRKKGRAAEEANASADAAAAVVAAVLPDMLSPPVGVGFQLPFLQGLLRLLPEASAMRPIPMPANFDENDETDWCPTTPVPDYFWLVNKIVDNLTPKEVDTVSPAGADNSSGSLLTSKLNLNSLCETIAGLLQAQPYVETRVYSHSVRTLDCLLRLATSVLRHKPSFKFSSKGNAFVESVFEYMFALPCSAAPYLPKCKAGPTRVSGMNLLLQLTRGCAANYTTLYNRLIAQHRRDAHDPYPWDYWPIDEARSFTGYVGLTNLGATCYMATTMQHLYMIPQLRQAVLLASTNTPDYEATLREIQKLFVFLSLSERKTYDPRGLCKTYLMDHQPLNTGEQKDMTEFFQDVIGKMEDMSPDLRVVLKSLFSGTMSNVVSSLDCPHVSRTQEDFYTVRCQVSDMRNINESLDEVCVKDTLEGDNMYNCSQCGTKVRAEKRACFKKLPKILCLNTMRYTFNYVTMLKEKVNTFFSFPERLNMADYMERNLLKKKKKNDDSSQESTSTRKPAAGVSGDQQVPADGSSDRKSGADNSSEADSDEWYELIGVTVHTGTADGGHYYSFIRERNMEQLSNNDRWLLFNDSEVKLWDFGMLASDCFGGEMKAQTYDTVQERVMDYRVERSNSAYMVFYERIDPPSSQHNSSPGAATASQAASSSATVSPPIIPTQCGSDKTTVSRAADEIPVRKPCEANPEDVSLASLVGNETTSGSDITGLLKNKPVTVPSNETGDATLSDNLTMSTEEPANENTSGESGFLSARHSDVDSSGSSATKSVDAAKITGVVGKSSRVADSCGGIVCVSGGGECEGGSPRNLSTGECTFSIPNELSDVVWTDNVKFLKDLNIFNSTYSEFMMEVCVMILCGPEAVAMSAEDQQTVCTLSAKLSAAYLLETYIHAKNKGSIKKWIEHLTHILAAEKAACKWVFDQMVEDDWWLQEILVKSPNATIRTVFRRLLVHVMKELFEIERLVHCYSSAEDLLPRSTVHAFLASFLRVLTVVRQPHIKNLSEYFHFLSEFARMGEGAGTYLNRFGAISVLINFYVHSGTMAMAGTDNMSVIDLCLGDDEDDDDDDDDHGIDLPEDKSRKAALESLVSLVTLLVEKSRNEPEQPHMLDLLEGDLSALISGKQLNASGRKRRPLTAVLAWPPNYYFIFLLLRDGLNAHLVSSLIVELSRYHDDMGQLITNMIMTSIPRMSSDSCSRFCQVLTRLADSGTTRSDSQQHGFVQFATLIHSGLFEMLSSVPLLSLEWLNHQVGVCPLTAQWAVATIDDWLGKHIFHKMYRIRTATQSLLYTLVPYGPFKQPLGKARQTYPKDMEIPEQALTIIHKIHVALLKLVPTLKQYLAAELTSNFMVPYFTVITACLVSKEEKLLLAGHFHDMWNIFHPVLSRESKDNSLSINHNKLTLITYWHALVDGCPENARLIVSNKHVAKGIVFNWIVSDFDDTSMVAFNRQMLPRYYRLLRACCAVSRQFTRMLSEHHNTLWAFEHIAPHRSYYQGTVDDIFELMSMMAALHEDSTEAEQKAVKEFKKSTIRLFDRILTWSTDFPTLLRVVKILIVSSEDHKMFLEMKGLQSTSESFLIQHQMHHEATACNMLTDLTEILEFLRVQLTVAKRLLDKKEPLDEGFKKTIMKWGNRQEVVKRCATLLNSHSPPGLRKAAIGLLRDILRLYRLDILPLIVSLFHRYHDLFHSEVRSPSYYTGGPHYPSPSAPARAGITNVTTPPGSNMTTPPGSTIRRTEILGSQAAPGGGKSRGFAHFNLSGESARKGRTTPVNPVFGLCLKREFIGETLDTLESKDPTFAKSLLAYYQPYHRFVDFLFRLAVNAYYCSKQLVNLSALVALEAAPLHSYYFAKLWTEIYELECLGEMKYLGLLLERKDFIAYLESILHEHRISLNNHHIFVFTYQFLRLLKFKCPEKVTLVRPQTVATAASTGLEKVSKAIAHSLANRKHQEIDCEAALHLLKTANTDLRALLVVMDTDPTIRVAQSTVVCIQFFQGFYQKCPQFISAVELLAPEPLSPPHGISAGRTQTCDKAQSDKSGGHGGVTGSRRLKRSTTPTHRDSCSLKRARVELADSDGTTAETERTPSGERSCGDKTDANVVGGKRTWRLSGGTCSDEEVAKRERKSVGNEGQEKSDTKQKITCREEVNKDLTAIPLSSTPAGGLLENVTSTTPSKPISEAADDHKVESSPMKSHASSHTRDPHRQTSVSDFMSDDDTVGTPGCSTCSPPQMPLNGWSRKQRFEGDNGWDQASSGNGIGDVKAAPPPERASVCGKDLASLRSLGLVDQLVLVAQGVINIIESRLREGHAIIVGSTGKASGSGQVPSYTGLSAGPAVSSAENKGHSTQSVGTGPVVISLSDSRVSGAAQPTPGASMQMGASIQMELPTTAGSREPGGRNVVQVQIVGSNVSGGVVRQVVVGRTADTDRSDKGGAVVRPSGAGGSICTGVASQSAPMAADATTTGALGKGAEKNPGKEVEKDLDL